MATPGIQQFPTNVNWINANTGTGQNIKTWSPSKIGRDDLFGSVSGGEAVYSCDIKAYPDPVFPGQFGTMIGGFEIAYFPLLADEFVSFALVDDSSNYVLLKVQNWFGDQLRQVFATSTNNEDTAVDYFGLSPADENARNSTRKFEVRVEGQNVNWYINDQFVQTWGSTPNFDVNTMRFEIRISELSAASTIRIARAFWAAQQPINV